jgi:hypothetical protein
MPAMTTSPRLPKLHQREDRGHDRTACELALGEGLVFDVHAERLASSEDEAREVLADLTYPARRVFDVALGIAYLPANGELVVVMRRPKPFEPRDLD